MEWHLTIGTLEAHNKLVNPKLTNCLTYCLSNDAIDYRFDKLCRKAHKLMFIIAVIFQ